MSYRNHKRKQRNPKRAPTNGSNFPNSAPRPTRALVIDDLPQDMLFEIFATLPVKYILRCKSVCESWNMLISSPSFKKFHLKRYVSKNAADYLLAHTANVTCLSIFDAETYEKRFDIELPRHNKYFTFGVYGSCNGVLCIAAAVHRVNVNDPIYLLNPSIKKEKLLPDCNTRPKTARFVALGFGFHEKEDDYKVVRIVKFRRKKDIFQVQVYSLALDGWRISAEAPPVSPDAQFPQSSMCVFLKGALHWIAVEPSEKCTSIVSFDLGSDVFRKIMFPDRLASVRFNNHIVLTARAFEESLSLFHVRESENSQYCDIWVVEADTWTMMRTIGLPQRGPVAWPLGIRTNGRVHVIRSTVVFGQPTLLVYNPASNEALDTEIRIAARYHYIDAYIENLISLD